MLLFCPLLAALDVPESGNRNAVFDVAAVDLEVDATKHLLVAVGLPDVLDAE
ncbi:hypothetical protein [Natronorubrum aibiense]|uniref:hypothetical protein n=1 Tax=Natronorubrum aibiense TaxID=348826 RepID=UPI00128F3224